MANQEVLNREHTIENNQVVITETVKKTLTLNELRHELNSYQAQQQGIINQVEELKKKYNILDDLAKQINDIIASFDDNMTFPEVPQESKL